MLTCFTFLSIIYILDVDICVLIFWLCICLRGWYQKSFSGLIFVSRIDIGHHLPALYRSLGRLSVSCNLLASYMSLGLISVVTFCMRALFIHWRCRFRTIAQIPHRDRWAVCRVDATRFPEPLSCKKRLLHQFWMTCFSQRGNRAGVNKYRWLTLEFVPLVICSGEKRPTNRPGVN